ncbi:PREDICTED: uncharacterized protein LOC104708251 [Camelina sativa]|uniref:Uncharacterized protein LOC104708251 n=1 Tax=Camelina sativa TaxID=90675 RepID=A0ABM0TA01_CAMSA|nr:PREDICTED: uncharacterized protein LOC104708251 [Camelina sativa]
MTIKGTLLYLHDIVLVQASIIIIIIIKTQEREKMSDWGPVLVTVILFVMLTPGLLFQLPGRQRYVEFGNFQTSAVSVIVHSLLYFSLVCVFLLALKIHIYIG